MSLNTSIHYRGGALHCDEIPVADIVAQVGTPAYIYSLRRALANLHSIQQAFATLQPHIHYSAKANANLSVLRALLAAGAGIDAVSAGEIHRALQAGAKPQQIVFAGVGKTPEEIAYAVQQGIGWFNVENVAECDLIESAAAAAGRTGMRVALRLNPEVTASTHPYIATGHGGAKFGLTAEVVSDLLRRQADYPHLDFAGLHVHIGSQLHDTTATQQAVRRALDLIAPWPHMRALNIGGGLPADYGQDETLPTPQDFAQSLAPLLAGYNVLLEPGRAIIADAGLLLARVLYVKQQGGQTFYITDASMAELLRPALYQAHHQIVPLVASTQPPAPALVVGPVCETADVLGHSNTLPPLSPGDHIAILTAGAYGMVMASSYNARPRPPEVVVTPDGAGWQVARRRETWQDLIAAET